MEYVQYLCMEVMALICANVPESPRYEIISVCTSVINLLEYDLLEWWFELHY